MNDHAGLHVVDPEIVLHFVAVMQIANLPDRLALRLLPGYTPLPLVIFELGKNVPGRAGELLQHFPLAIHAA